MNNALSPTHEILKGGLMYCALHIVAIDLIINLLLLVFNMFNWITQVMFFLQSIGNENIKATVITQLEGSWCQC